MSPFSRSTTYHDRPQPPHLVTLAGVVLGTVLTAAAAAGAEPRPSGSGHCAVLPAAAAAGAEPARSPADPPAGRPNIVFFLVDDLGWTDLACYGSDLHETPRMDRLAQQSIRFTDAYAASVCSPTRAMIMTGEHPARLHMTIWREGAPNPPRGRKLIPPVTRENLPLEKVTIAERLRSAGYHTIHIGKWHLGDSAHYPEAQGFDVNIGGTHWGCPATFFYPYRGWFHDEYRYVPGLPYGKPGEYLTDRLTDEAIRAIDAAGDRPFFLYLAYHTVHTPIEAKADRIAHFRRKLRPGLRHVNPVYAAMVSSLDENVGRVLDHLDQRGMTEKTAVIFASDNGGFVGRWKDQPVVTNNAPLRSGKGSLYEGGIRVPLLIRWPGVTRPGTVCREPVILADLYPTILDMAALAGDPGERSLDGTSLAPCLRDPSATLGPRTLYWHYPHYYPTTTPVSAIRSGPWKLLEFFEDDHVELYNLEDDLGETRDLAAQLPARRDELRRQLRAWRESVNAQMPVSNPRFTR